jgi:hypothetical protein
VLGVAHADDHVSLLLAASNLARHSALHLSTTLAADEFQEASALGWLGAGLAQRFINMIEEFELGVVVTVSTGGADDYRMAEFVELF